MKRVSAGFALIALAAATLAIAQVSPAAPPPSATPQQQAPTTPPSDPSAGTGSDNRSADKEAMMKDCLTQVQSANPGVPANDIKAFCDREVNNATAPQAPSPRQ